MHSELDEKAVEASEEVKALCEAEAPAVTDAQVEAAARALVALAVSRAAPAAVRAGSMVDRGWIVYADDARAALTAARTIPASPSPDAARAAALEEAARVAKHYGGECNMLQNDNVDREANSIRRDAAYEIETRIRALTPKTEEA